MPTRIVEKDQENDGPFENRRVNSSEIAPDAEGPFGVRLSDDMLNVFCDRVQLAAPDRINGFFAIQSILCDPASLRSQIQPRQEVIQIVFDQEREHYITAHLFYVNKVPTLRVYDPLLHAKNVRNRDLKDMMSPSIIRQILDLFGHLLFGVAQPGVVPVEYVHDIDPQTDGWSCGYRAIGVVMDLLRDRRPIDSNYDARSLYDLYIWANRDGSHSWHEFMKFPYRSYRLRNYVRNGIVVFTEEFYKEKVDKTISDERMIDRTRKPNQIKKEAENQRPETPVMPTVAAKNTSPQPPKKTESKSKETPKKAEKNQTKKPVQMVVDQELSNMANCFARLAVTPTQALSAMRIVVPAKPKERKGATVKFDPVDDVKRRCVEKMALMTEMKHEGPNRTHSSIAVSVRPQRTRRPVLLGKITKKNCL
ncbi:unnamed protein product, partial [Mesorhabditis belari]|uniref:Ubiquitin-like protease family profile domain-containing protein n=1 Tax=Mesorhabditis belari TaxID=2138241 RepID=A0AAF3EUL6_9BILA